MKKHAGWRLWATLERPPARRGVSDPAHDAPRRSSEHGWRAWGRRSGVYIARRCTTACTVQASFSGEPREHHGLRRSAQPTAAAPPRSLVIMTSQVCSLAARAATRSLLVPAVQCSRLCVSRLPLSRRCGHACATVDWPRSIPIQADQGAHAVARKETKNVIKWPPPARRVLAPPGGAAAVFQSVDLARVCSDPVTQLPP